LEIRSHRRRSFGSESASGKIAREIAMPKIEDFVEGDPVVEDVEDDSDEDSDDDGPPERERPACEPHPFWF